jgi:hypothetical protein
VPASCRVPRKDSKARAAPGLPARAQERPAKRLASSGGDLDDLTHAPAGQEDPARGEGTNPNRAGARVEQDHVDRKPHPERVDGSTTLEQESFVGVKTGPSAEPAHALTPVLGDEDHVGAGVRSSH